MRLLILIFLPLLLASCAGKQKVKRPPVPKGPVVVEIEFQGNRTFKEKELRNAISTEESSKILFWQKKHLNVGEVDNDRERLRTFYQMHGFFNVAVAPVRVVPYTKSAPKNAKKPGDEGYTEPEKLGLDQPVPGPKLETPAGRAPVLAPLREEMGPDVAAPGAPPVSSPGPEAPKAASPQAPPEGKPPAGPPGSEAPVQAGETSPAPASGQPTEAPPGEGATAAAGTPASPAPAPLTAEQASRVRVIYQISEGSRFKVSDIRIKYGDLPPALIARLQLFIRLRPGEYYNLEQAEATQNTLQDQLRQASYAWATVTDQTVVLPRENGVRVRYQIDPGPPSVFGQLQLEGLKDVRQTLVTDRARRFIVSGRPYNQQALQDLQQQLYSLQLFQTVLVVPTADSRGKPQVDILVRVRERPFRLLKAGGGFTQEPGWQELTANVSWTHSYFRRRLARLNLYAQGGWAASPNLWSPEAFPSFEKGDNLATLTGRNGPILDTRVNLTLPDFKARLVSVSGEARFVIGQTRAYGYVSPQLRLSVARPIQKHLIVSVGLAGEDYQPTWWDPISNAVFESEELSVSESNQGNQGNQEAGTKSLVRFKGLLTYVEQTATYDRRDNILFPEKGLYGALNLQEAGLLGNFSFIKIRPDLRGYFPVVAQRLVLAGRLATGLIFPLSGTLTCPTCSGAPPVLRFETGGGDSIRGYGRDQITWYTGADCQVASPIKTDACPIETGGNIMYLANFEARVPLGAFTVVGFIDAGQVKAAADSVASRWVDFSPAELQVSVGGGLRYRTVIGPIRLDFGYRVRDPLNLDVGLKAVGGGCPCGLHLAIGEAF